MPALVIDIIPSNDASMIRVMFAKEPPVCQCILDAIKIRFFLLCLHALATLAL
jgi:hypothetical protein